MNRYYIKINSIEYVQAISQGVVDINLNLFKYVKDLFEDKMSCNSKIKVKMNSSKGWQKYISIHEYDRCIMNIMEREDEWFYIIEPNDLYHKCDQVEGVIKYLNEK